MEGSRGWGPIKGSYIWGPMEGSSRRGPLHKVAQRGSPELGPLEAYSRGVHWGSLQRVRSTEYTEGGSMEGVPFGVRCRGPLEGVRWSGSPGVSRVEVSHGRVLWMGSPGRDVNLARNIGMTKGVKKDSIIDTNRSAYVDTTKSTE